jgi:hypothetical protein
VSCLNVVFALQAAQQGHTQIVNLLLEAGASPNSLSNVSAKYAFLFFYSAKHCIFGCFWRFKFAPILFFSQSL